MIAETQHTRPNLSKNIFVFGLSILGYLILLFFTPRNQFFLTYSLFIGLFILYWIVIKKSDIFSFRSCLIFAFIFRAIAMFSMPALSDDFFRFIWDGQMLNMHINPFAFTPDNFIASHHDPYLTYLHGHMNSAEYFTIYPAVLQYIFYVSAKLFPTSVYGSIVVLKSFILLSEFGTAIFLYKYAKLKKINPRNILWFILNPLVIVELTGNVHFEAVMIFFLVAMFYFLEVNKILIPAFCWALAICAKLLPLMLAPLLLMYLGINKFLKFGLITLICLIILFIPLIDNSLLNIQYSVGKFYDLFEFNASFYYFFNFIYGLYSNEDISEIIAKLLGIFSIIIILFISFFKFNKKLVLTRGLEVYTVYLFCATMVHPWYIITLIAFMPFTKYRFPIVFSILIPLSYFSYSLNIFEENMWMILLEYGLLFSYILFEIKCPKISNDLFMLVDN